MQDLKVIGVENGALLAVGDDGERFRIAVDDALQSKVRQVRLQTSASAPKLSPREIQAHIRAGMSAEDVASVTGAPIDYVQRFEGPIVAEREHIVASALSVPVVTTAEVDPLGEGNTFGSVIRDRLASLGVTGERWAGWKDSEAGWIVKLEFTADTIEHDARWSYDARKHSLAPVNSEATTLSQAGELKGGVLIPRLRAVMPHEGEPDNSRFDSGAFTFPDSPSDFLGPEITLPLEPLTPGRTPGGASNSITVSAIKRADDETPRDLHQTADLLEALRRRRGEREAAVYEEKHEVTPAKDTPLPDPEGQFARFTPPTATTTPLPTVTLSPAPAPAAPPAAPPAPAPSATGGADAGQGSASGGSRSSRKGRASMPSWDEIVFGARTDDDLA